MKQVLLLTLIFSIAFAEQNGNFTDPRDENTYRTVKIGKQVWMAQNLNYEVEGKGSKCYNDKPENCDKYGRLYNWKTAIKVCPKGWHLPSHDEWDVFYEYIDSTYYRYDNSSEIAGKHLKAKNGWDYHQGRSCNGDDTFGFTALPGGRGDYSRRFSFLGINSFWWSSSEVNATLAYYRYLHYISDGAGWSEYTKSHLLSVRCLQD